MLTASPPQLGPQRHGCTSRLAPWTEADASGGLVGVEPALPRPSVELRIRGARNSYSIFGRGGRSSHVSPFWSTCLLLVASINSFVRTYNPWHQESSFNFLRSARPGGSAPMDPRNLVPRGLPLFLSLSPWGFSLSGRIGCRSQGIPP